MMHHVTNFSAYYPVIAYINIWNMQTYTLLIVVVSKAIFCFLKGGNLTGSCTALWSVLFHAVIWCWSLNGCGSGFFLKKDHYFCKEICHWQHWDLNWIWFLTSLWRPTLVWGGPIVLLLCSTQRSSTLLLDLWIYLKSSQ